MQLGWFAEGDLQGAPLQAGPQGDPGAQSLARLSHWDLLLVGRVLPGFGVTILLSKASFAPELLLRPAKASLWQEKTTGPVGARNCCAFVLLAMLRPLRLAEEIGWLGVRRTAVAGCPAAIAPID
jgi:hypothetical protein